MSTSDFEKRIAKLDAFHRKCVILFQIGLSLAAISLLLHILAAVLVLENAS